MSAINELVKIQRTETLTEQTYLSIRQLLMTGKLSPGEKLTGRQIAKAMNVSLTPSREAIGRLIAEGALIPGVYQGALVPELTVSMYSEISECRLLLEGSMAYQSVSKFNVKDIYEIEKLVEKMAKATDNKNFSQILHYNTEFHFKVYNMAKMPIMLNIVESLWLKIGPTLNLLRPFYQETKQGISYHSDFVEAIKVKSPSKARKAITQDISLATKHILKLLKDRN